MQWKCERPAAYVASEELMMRDLLVNALVAEGDADDPGFLLTRVPPLPTRDMLKRTSCPPFLPKLMLSIPKTPCGS